MNEMGPWEYKEGLDRWRADRWSADREAVAKEHLAQDERRLREHNERAAMRGEPAITLQEYRTKHYIRGADNDLWLWPSDVPRTCSFCGGIHPEDAIRLLNEGWEVEATDKGYKRYLGPPGTRALNEAIMASIRAGAPQQQIPAGWSPVPPVKLYVQHLNEEQVERFNAALRAAREGLPQ